jgi:hypothetical protein
MITVKKVSIFCSVVLIMSIGAYGIHEWVTKEIINASTLFYVFLGIGFLFQSLTWGEMDGKHEGEKDEMEKHITLLSSKISYYLLLFLMLIVLMVSEKVTAMNDLKIFRLLL